MRLDKIGWDGMKSVEIIGYQMSSPRIVGFFDLWQIFLLKDRKLNHMNWYVVMNDAVSIVHDTILSRCIVSHGILKPELFYFETAKKLLMSEVGLTE